MPRTRGVLPRHALLPFAVSLFGRFGYAGHGLAVLLYLNHPTRSLTVAGPLDAAFALTATGTVPLRARLMDRRGAGRVLPTLGALYATALCGLLAMGQWAPAPLLALPLLVMGLSAPPMGVVMRVLWAALVPRELLAKALGRDAVAEELSIVCGPLAGGLAAASLSPEAAVAVTGALLTGAAGALGRVSRHHLPPASGAAHRQARSVALPVRLAPVLLVLGALGVLLGVVDVAAVAVPGVGALPGGAGSLLALLSAGSAVGAVVQGRLGDPAAPLRRAALLTAGAGGLAGALAFARTPLWWAAGFALLGPCVSPAMVAGYLWVARTAQDAAAEANAWANTALGVGGALGTAAAGVGVGTYGPGRVCVAAGGAVLGAVCLVALGRRYRRGDVRAGVLSIGSIRDVQRPGSSSHDQGEARENAR
jgi:predicted MFS family arabinose efflux permease